LAELKKQHSEITDVSQMRSAMHNAMVAALQAFARRMGIIGEGESVVDFKELFDVAKRKNVPLNAYKYMNEYRRVLFSTSPLMEEITAIANAERHKLRAGINCHTDVMAAILGNEGARAVMYDAVAVEASRVVRNNQELRQHFSESDETINITQDSVRRLQEINPILHKEFQKEVVTGLTRDRGRMTATSWILDKNDPAREEIVRRARSLRIDGNPDQAAHNLGKIILGDGREVTAHVVHAVDPVITDGVNVVMIDRKNDPGKGKPALPGGFIDPRKGGGVESGVDAAAREALEEVGVALGEGKLIGRRNMERPFDVRVAQEDFPQYGIKKNDIFLVSTQAVRFDVPDLSQTKLVASDDAEPGSARRVSITSLTKESVGIPDHYNMIQQATAELAKSHEHCDHVELDPKG
jgi:8-oxo-dGTP pyrophosphatase MutT (NUDIX family)